MTVVFYADRLGEWRWRLMARNGRILADSGEGYRSKRNARRAWDRVRVGLWFESEVMSEVK